MELEPGSMPCKIDRLLNSQVPSLSQKGHSSEPQPALQIRPIIPPSTDSLVQQGFAGNLISVLPLQPLSITPWLCILALLISKRKLGSNSYSLK
jgi:hypothetical protein